MMIKHGIFSLVVASLFKFGSFYNTPEEGHLLETLLKDRSQDIRPLPKQINRPTVVNISIRIVQPLEIDEKNEIISLLTWTTMEWEDSTFAWNPGAHRNITKLFFPAEYIWIPDIILYNTQEISSGFHLGLPEKDEDLPFLAVAYPDGRLSLAFPHIYKSTCELKISEYPFDTQNCPLTFGSWSYNESEVIINIALYESTAYTVSNKAWQLVDHKCSKIPSRCAFDDVGENCQLVQCFIGLKRTAWFEVISYTLPTIIIAILSIMVFMVPPEAGKRMEVGITLILCVAVYLSLINKKMPSTSESFPLVSKFYGCVIVEITIAMVCSCYCLHIYDPEGLRLLHFPNHLRTLAFGILARLTFYRTKGGKPSRVHPTNAELKIVEKRRRSMIAVNSSIQLAQNSHSTIKQALSAKENGQLRNRMEDIEECPETPNDQREEEKEVDSNNSEAQTGEERQESAGEAPIADAEEEIVEEVINAAENVNDNRIVGENRCDSGFGEPGGSISNRSSLLSSNSVQLPVDASSTSAPQCGTNCECGHINCSGQSGIENNHPNQDTSTEDAAIMGEENLDGNRIGSEEGTLAKFGNLVKYQNANTEVWSLKRAQTGFIRESKVSNGGPLSQMLSARPYTDSVLATWRGRRSTKQFQSSLRSNASLNIGLTQKADPGRQNEIKSSASIPSKSDQNGNGSEVNKVEISEQIIERSDSKSNTAKVSNDNSSRRASTRSNKSNSEKDVTVSTAGNNNDFNVQSDHLGSRDKAVQEVKVDIRAEPSLDSSKVNSTTGKTRQTFDEIELVDVNEEENLESSAQVTTDKTKAVIARRLFDKVRRDEGHDAVLTTGSTSAAPKTDENQMEQISGRKERGSDSDTDFDGSDEEKINTVKRRNSEDRLRRQSSMVDPKVLFARRQWDTLRNRMQRRITVKEVFGQILSPKETSPIVAIANVLLRDQRKYVMRTEWMTSAIIFNRFFIILLALAVFISLLAVFLQSSRLRTFFES